MNPLRPLIQTYCGYVMNTYIRAEIDMRFHELKSASPTGRLGRSKPVIALALEAYMAENSTKDGLDERFMKQLTYQIRPFLFAGNDTTSSSIVFTYHLLSSHQASREPDAAKPVPLHTRHNQRDTTPLPTHSHHTVQCPGIVLTDRHNNYYPVDYVSASVQHAAIHSSPQLWPRASEFLPERFLIPKGHEL